MDHQAGGNAGRVDGYYDLCNCHVALRRRVKSVVMHVFAGGNSARRFGGRPNTPGGMGKGPAVTIRQSPDEVLVHSRPRGTFDLSVH